MKNAFRKLLSLAAFFIVVSVALIYYFVSVDRSICSDISDCSEDQYCSPLNHYKDSYSEGQDPPHTVFVEKLVNNNIEVKEDYILINNKKYKYKYKNGNYYHSEINKYIPEEKYIIEKTQRQVMYAPLFLVIQKDDKDYGICQKKPKNFQPQKECGKTTRLPDRIEKGKFEPWYAITLDCI